MAIDKELIRKMAHLARLDFNEQDEKKMVDSLNQILDWVDKLNELDTTHVEPLIHLSEEVNVLRKDEAQPPLEREKGLLNAPKRDGEYFRVPKVLE
jgi:aspartyl-tRNA(Asn)/glutamyl-tRNA(Gln) amidotransferase subunit C